MLDWITEYHNLANFTHKIDNHIVPENRLSEQDSGIGWDLVIYLKKARIIFLAKQKWDAGDLQHVKASGLLIIATVISIIWCADGGQVTRVSSVCGTMDTVLMIKIMDPCCFAWQPESTVGENGN